MSEVEKLYELAGVEPYKICNSCVDNNGNMITNSKDCSFRNFCSNACDVPHYELTAEKQLKLIKWLIKQDLFDNGTQGAIDEDFNFENGLAKIVNNLWQDLTETEQKEIKKILKG